MDKIERLLYILTKASSVVPSKRNCIVAKADSAASQHYWRDKDINVLDDL